MAKTIDSQGTYKVKDTGEEVSYTFNYPSIESVEDAVATLGEAKIKSLIQRMIKVDANNLSRESAKTANGHSTRAVLTEEQKAERKAQRQADRELLAIIKQKGLDVDAIRNI